MGPFSRDYGTSNDDLHSLAIYIYIYNYNNYVLTTTEVRRADEGAD